MGPAYHPQPGGIFSHKTLFLVFHSFPDCTVVSSGVLLKLLVYPVHSILARHAFGFVSEGFGGVVLFCLCVAACCERCERFLSYPGCALAIRVDLKGLGGGVVHGSFQLLVRALGFVVGRQRRSRIFSTSLGAVYSRPLWAAAKALPCFAS